MRIDRKEFLEELKLREYISGRIKSILESSRQKAQSEEEELRMVIRGILKEAEDAEKAPHSSTGINVLADTLKKIIPVIEDDYKRLTTDPTQRESYRAHIINAAQNAIAPVSASAGAADEEGADADGGSDELSDDEMLELEEIDIVVGDEAEEIEDEEADVESDALDDEEPDESAFIDINDAPAEEEDTFGLPDKDDTGRNFAQATFEKIEKQIIDAYALLSNDEDKELFYSYLITNLKLYFDRFEDELASVLPEPTNQEYEDEKDEQDAEDEEGEEAAGEDEGEDDELDLGGDEEELEL